MRPVDKGEAPKVYTNYGKARHNLAEKIGYYCSYCEMKIANGIEVEHILPRNQGGAPLDWDNFLLSCKYCNTIKSDHNSKLSNYLWADRDNTDLAFFYSEANAISPKTTLAKSLQVLAQNTIDLMGLNRFPKGKNTPTEADTRWRSRKKTWDIAKFSYTDWKEAPIMQMAKQIARTSLSGHYSIWTEVFKKEPLVLKEIDKIYTKIGLYKKYTKTGERKLRKNGKI